MSNKPWSTAELRDLRDGLRTGTPIPQLATRLGRGVEEVEAKIADLTAHHASGEQPSSTEN